MAHEVEGERREDRATDLFGSDRIRSRRRATPSDPGRMKRLALLTALLLLTAPTASATTVHRPTEYVVSTTPGETLEGIAVTPSGTPTAPPIETGSTSRRLACGQA